MFYKYLFQRVKAARIKRIAPQNSPNSFNSASEEAVFSNRLDSILRTSRGEAAKAMGIEKFKDAMIKR